MSPPESVDLRNHPYACCPLGSLKKYTALLVNVWPESAVLWYYTQSQIRIASMVGRQSWRT